MSSKYYDLKPQREADLQNEPQDDFFYENQYSSASKKYKKNINTSNISSYSDVNPYSYKKDTVDYDIKGKYSDDNIKKQIKSMLYESESKIYPNRTKIDYGQESLNETMNRLQNEKEALLSYINEGNEKKAYLQSSILKMKTRNEELSRENESLRKDLSYSNEQIQSLKKICDDLQKEKDDALMREQIHLQKINDLEYIINQKSNEISHLQEMQQSLIETAQDTKAEVENLKSSKEGTFTELQNLKIKLEKKEIIVNSLQDELKKLKNKINEEKESFEKQMYEKEKASSEQLRKVESELISEREKNRVSREEFRRLCDMFNQLCQDFDFTMVSSHKIDVIQEHSNRIRFKWREMQRTLQEQKVAFETLEEQLEKTVKERESLKDHIDQLNAEMDQVQKTKETLMSQLKESEKKIIQSQEALQSFMRQKHVEKNLMTETIFELKHEVEVLKRNLKDKQDAEDALNQQIKELEDTLKKKEELFNANNDKLQSELNQQKSMIESLKMEKQTLDEEYNQMNALLNEKETKIKQITRNENILNETVDDLKQRVDRVTREKENLQQNLNELIEEKNKTYQLWKEVTEKYNKLEAEVLEKKNDKDTQHRVLLRRIQLLEKQLSEAQKGNEDITKSREDLKAMEKKLKEEKEKNAELQGRLKVLMDENSEIKTNLEALTNQLKENERQFEISKEEYEISINQSSLDYKQQLEEKESTIQSLRKEISKMNNKLDEVEKHKKTETESLLAIINGLKAEIIQKKEEMRKLLNSDEYKTAAKTKLLEEEVETLNSTNGTLLERINSLEQQINELNSEITNLRNENEKLKKFSLAEPGSKIQETIIKYTNEISEKNAKILELERTIIHLNRKLSKNQNSDELQKHLKEIFDLKQQMKEICAAKTNQVAKLLKEKEELLEQIAQLKKM